MLGVGTHASGVLVPSVIRVFYTRVGIYSYKIRSNMRMLTVSILFNNVLNLSNYPDTARIIEGTICFKQME